MEHRMAGNSNPKKLNKNSSHFTPSGNMGSKWKGVDEESKSINN
jgi:hypothetical protein